MVKFFSRVALPLCDRVRARPCKFFACSPACMASFRARLETAASAVRSAATNKRYKSVTTSEVRCRSAAYPRSHRRAYHPHAPTVAAPSPQHDSAFSIEDGEESTTGVPDINRLNAQHAELLRQAESTISSTETHVQWLREERLQARLSLSTDTLPLPSASSCTRANRGSEDGEDDSPTRASSTEPAVRGGATRARRAAELLRGATEAVLSRLSSDVHNSVGRRHLQAQFSRQEALASFFPPSSTWSTWSAQ